MSGITSRRTPSLAALLAALAFVPVVSLTGCEGDVLTPTTGFKPSECLNDPNCDGSGTRLDAGLLTPDAALPAPDSGADPVDSGGVDPPDAGVVPTADAGPMDPPDSGPMDPPDSGVLPDSGLCNPGAPPPFLTLHNSLNDTAYRLDLSDFLGGVGNLAGPLDLIDQALQGNIDTGFAPLDNLIAGVIQQYIPPWVGTIVNVLNNIANFFEEVDVTGLMRLYQDAPVADPATCAWTSALNGTEDWTSMTVKLINRCPRGRADPNYPACANQTVSIVPAGRTGVGPLDVEVDVKPFRGVLQPGRPQADFVLDPREVDMDVYKLITIVIDLAISVGTNGQYQTLQAALNAAVDCNALAQRAYNFATQTLGLNAALGLAAQISVRDACNDVKRDAINAIVGGLNGIGVGLAAMDFRQLGRAVDTNNNGRPETLQSMATPNTIDGRFRVVFRADLGGTWRGTNRAP
jgi:hypothetical protein